MSLKFLASILISASLQQVCLAAVLETDTRSSTARPITTGSSVRINGSNTGRTSRVRTREQVRQHRSAHAHARLNHVFNHLSTAHTGTIATHTQLARVTAIEPHAAYQSLVITANHHDDKKSGTHHKDKGEKKEDERKSERKSEKRKGFFHRLRNRGAQEASNSGGAGPGSGNQGIGDGSNVSYTATNNIGELKDGILHMTLDQGTAFVAHNRPVSLKTSRGEVKIASDSAVYVVAEGKSVSIYDIADRKDNDVAMVTLGNMKLEIKAGEQLLLADKDIDFEKANPVPEIKSTRMRELGFDGGTRIFHAEFSPLHALDHAKGFHELVNSKSPADQKLANHILKTAAVVLNLRAGDSD